MLRFQNVYRRCLCFIFDQTTMAQEQKSRRALNFSPTVRLLFVNMKNCLAQESENVRPYSSNSIENATPL